MSRIKTLKEKRETEPSTDRQNTIWSKQIVEKCKHEWQPVSFVFETDTDYSKQPDITNGKVYCVCMKCFGHTYVETGWIGYFIGSPDILESKD